MSIILFKDVWTPFTTPRSSSFGVSNRSCVTVKSADHNPKIHEFKFEGTFNLKITVD